MTVERTCSATALWGYGSRLKAGTTAERLASAGATVYADRASAPSIMFTALPMP